MRTFSSKFIRYFMTGGVAAVVDAAGFGLLIGLGIDALVAATTSFIVAAVVNYQLSSRFVFDSEPTRRRFYKFLTVASLGMLFNVAITTSLINSFHLFPIAAKIIAIGVTFVVNFLLNIYIVFKK